LGVRLHQRRPFKVPRKELLRQKAPLHYQLQTFASEGCVVARWSSRSDVSK
jgi:hypothetical protein